VLAKGKILPQGDQRGWAGSPIPDLRLADRSPNRAPACGDLLSPGETGGVPPQAGYTVAQAGGVDASVPIGRTSTPEVFMNTAMFLAGYLATSLVAGLLGGLAMELAMWLIARAGLAKGDMILALGSLLTKTRENAYRVGLLIHVTAALGFGLVYTLLMVVLGYTHMPMSLMLGLGVGVFHGIVVSLMLVWVVSDRHPLEEFKEADLLVGLTHFAAHVVYGGVVGLVVGLSPML
jgi:hypothetical protein